MEQSPIYNKIIVLFIFLILWIGLFVYIIKNVDVRKITLFGIVLATTILFSLSNSMIYSDTMHYGFDTQENGYMAVMDSAYIINKMGGDVKCWYDINEYNNGDRYGELFKSINSIYLYVYSDLNLHFPDIDINRNSQFLLKNLINNEKTGEKTGYYKVVIISTKENAYEMGKEVLENVGAKVKMLSQKEVKRGNVKFNLTFIEVSMSRLWSKI